MYLILPDVLELSGLRVSRNGKYCSVMVLWDKKYKNEILALSTIFRFLYFLYGLMFFLVNYGILFWKTASPRFCKSPN